MGVGERGSWEWVGWVRSRWISSGGKKAGERGLG